MVSEKINEIYGNKIRIRVCGILTYNNKVLMLNHVGLNTENIFWNFPGGGIEPSESLSDGLRREFVEETGLEISIVNLCNVNQFIAYPLHAVEFYFIVNAKNYEVEMGSDPEFNIISDFRWFTWEEIWAIPQNQKTSFFSNFSSITALIQSINPIFVKWI